MRWGGRGDEFQANLGYTFQASLGYSMTACLKKADSLKGLQKDLVLIAQP